MLMQDEELAELKTLLAKSRQRPISFGLSLGKKPEDTVLILDLKKPPQTLMRNAKKAGETPKVTCGSCEVSGKIVTLTCEADIPAGIAKAMKKFFSAIGTNFKVVVVDANGGAFESDGDEDGSAESNQTGGSDSQNAGPSQEEAPANADPMAARWQQIDGALDPMIQSFSASGHEKGAAVGKAWSGARAAAAKGDFKGALSIAGKLKQVIDTAKAASGSTTETAPKEPETNPDLAKWEAVSAPLAALHSKAMAANPANRTQLNAAYMMAVEKAEAGDFKAALVIAGKITPALKKAMESQGAADEVPKDVVAFQKSRLLWAGTRRTMHAELKKLQDAIQSALGADPEFAAAAGEVGNLTNHLAEFDDQLETVLDDITNTAEGPERDALKRKAAELVKQYQAALQADFFSDVDQNNGFANVAVASSAVKSLGSIAKVLAA